MIRMPRIPCLPPLALALAMSLGGCAGGPSGSESGTATEAVSQTPAVGDARNRAKIHTELGSLYFQAGNMAVALEEIRVAVDADAGYAPAYNIRGLIHMYLRENAIADDNFRRALSLAAGDPEINNNYGWFLCQTGRGRESLAYFGNAIKNPLFATPEKSYVNAGICALKINDVAAAEDYLQKALRFGAKAVAAYYPLADLNYRRGRFDEARRLLAEFHRTGEPTAESLWLATRTERHLGDRGAEASFATQLRRRFPDSKESADMKRGIYE